MEPHGFCILQNAKRFTNSNFFSKLRTAVYPSKSAPIGLKLWQNAFQAIPDISFFDAEKNKSSKIFRKQNYKKLFSIEMKNCKSSETHFAKVSHRSKLFSGGKRPFEVSKKIRNSPFYFAFKIFQKFRRFQRFQKLLLIGFQNPVK